MDCGNEGGTNAATERRRLLDCWDFFPALGEDVASSTSVEWPRRLSGKSRLHPKSGGRTTAVQSLRRRIDAAPVRRRLLERTWLLIGVGASDRNPRREHGAAVPMLQLPPESNMNIRAILAFLPMVALLLLSGCEDAGDSRARRFHTEASQAMALCKNGDKTYSEVLELHQWAAARIDRILKDFPSSEIALGLTSGRTTISGRTLDQFRGLEATLKPLAAAENDPLACALLFVDSMEPPWSKSEMLSGIAGTIAERGQKEKALQLLSEALALVKPLKDRRLDYRVARVLAALYAKAGDFDRALEMARTIEDRYSQSRALAAIATESARAGKKEQATRLLSEVLVMVNSLEYSGAEAETFVEIAGKFAEAGDLKTAVAIAGRIEFGWMKSHANAVIARAYAAIGDFAHAIEVATRIEDSRWRCLAWTLIASQYTKNKQSEQADRMFSKAIATANGIARSNDKLMCLTEIAGEYAQGGQKEQAMQLLAQAHELAKGMKGQWGVDSALADIAIKYAEVGEFDRALEMARTMESAYFKASILTGMASAYAKSGQMDRATELFSEGIEAAKLIGGADDKFSAMAGIAGKYAEAGQREKVLQLLPYLIETAGTVVHEHASQKSGALAKIAGKYAGIGEFTRAMETAKMVSDVSAKSEALSDIASKAAVIDEKQKASRVLAQVLEMAMAIDGIWKHDETLAVIATEFAEIGDFTRAVETANPIRDEHDKSKALADIALLAAKAGQTEQASRLFSQAVETAKRIEHRNDTSRAEALV